MRFELVKSESVLMDDPILTIRKVLFDGVERDVLFSGRLPIIGSDAARLREALENALLIPDAIKREPEPKYTPSKRPPRTPRETFLYIMHNKRNNLYKIGISGNPKFREKTIQSEEPEVEILYVFEALDSKEKSLHAEYAHKRVRGEWFRLSPEDVFEIVTQLNGWKSAREL